jgi:hypothetical protein
MLFFGASNRSAADLKACLEHSSDPVAQRAAIDDGFKLGFDHLPKSAGVMPASKSFFELQLMNVLVAVQGKEPLICPGNEAREAVALIERCYARRQHLRQPWLPKMEQSKLEALGS